MKAKLLYFTLFFVLICNTLSAQFKLILEQKLIDSLNIRYKNEKSDTAKILLLPEIAYEYSIDKPDTCLYIGNLALQESQKIGFIRGIGYANWVIGRAYLWKREKDKALEHTTNAINIGKKINDYKLISKAYVSKGIVYKYILNKIDSAILILKKAVEMAELSKDLKEISESYNNLSDSHSSLENYDSAMYYAQKSLSTCKIINKSSLLSDCYERIGSIYMFQKKFLQAKEQYNISLKIAENMRDTLKICSTLLSVYSLHENQLEYQKAKDVLLTIINLSEKINHQRLMGVCYLWISDL